MRSALLLVAAVGLCLCAAQAATPVPTWSVPGTSSATVKAVSSAGAAAQTTIPTVAGLPADTTSLASSKTAARTSPTVRTTTPRSQTTAPTTAAPTKAPTTITTSGSITAQTLTATVPTLWPNATAYSIYPPAESRTPDIDPGMTP